jgi:hypothetical protein
MFLLLRESFLVPGISHFLQKRQDCSGLVTIVLTPGKRTLFNDRFVLIDNLILKMLFFYTATGRFTFLYILTNLISL